MDRWHDEPSDDTDDQPDNPQAWHRPEPRPRKPSPGATWIDGQWREPGWDDNPQRWHRD